jgi:hypothetical protein
MAHSLEQPRGLASRTAGWAAACLVLLVHLVVAPALPGCHCRHRADTRCPHEDSAPEPEPPAAVEGAHCHVAPEAATRTAESDGAGEAERLGAPQVSHHGAGAIVGHCDDGERAPKSYRVGEPYWPVVELVDAPALGFEPTATYLIERSGSDDRLLDPPLSPPPRVTNLA